jgi:recombination endonuclease subunit|nr:MAG TPA: STRUCTURAL MAINTENANCE OF CHROMOSOMES PROTEIN [Caudoviricetes sp.]
MNNIHFKKLTARNLASIGNQPITIELDRNPSTLIIGKNGAGKSSLLLDALCFNLYGKPFRSITKGQLVNQKNNRELMTEVSLSRGEQNIIIKRGYKPAIFEIYVDGNLIDQSAKAKDYQEWLEDNILGIDQQAFMQMVIVGRANYTPFLSLRAADKRAFVERVLALDIFSSMSTIAKDDAKQAKAKLSDAERNLLLANANVEHAKSAYDKLYQSAMQSVQEKQAIYDQQIREKQKELDELQESKKLLEEQAIQYDKALHDRLVKALTDCDARIGQYHHSIEQSSKQLAFIHHNEQCPACKQSISDTYKQEMMQSLESSIDDTKATEVKIREMRERIYKDETRQRRYLMAQEFLSHKNKDIAQVKASIESLQRQKDACSEMPDISHAQREVDRAETAAQSLEASYNAQAADMRYHDFIIQALRDDGIKAIILKDFVPMLNQVINQNLAALGLFATIEIDECFDEKIKMRGFEEMAYNQLSEGEKLRLDMAVMLAWRDIARYKANCSTNLLIMDEIFDSSADAEGTAAFADLLRSIADLNVFVITHTPEKLSDSFTSSIQLTKQDGFTVIMETK